MNFYQKMPEILKNSIFPILAFAGAGNGSWLRGNSASQWVFREYITKSPKIQGFPPQNPRISSQIHTWVGLGTASVWFPSPSWPSLFSPKANTEPLSAGTTGIQGEKTGFWDRCPRIQGQKGQIWGKKGGFLGKRRGCWGSFHRFLGKRSGIWEKKGRFWDSFPRIWGQKGRIWGKRDGF